jgi:hypothetical protein
VIGVELGRENQYPRNCDQKGLEPLDVRTDLSNQIKLVVKTKKKT